MKKNFRKLRVFIFFVALMFIITGCFNNDGEYKKIEVPVAVHKVKDKVIKIAEDYSEQLNGDFGDKHVSLINTSTKDIYDKDIYNEMKVTLDDIREKSGAYYVYVLYSKELESEYYNITVDGSVEPDEWFNEYEYEIQFKEAMEGNAAAARSAWDDDTNDLCWSAFAPIYNSNGDIVAILGVDYPSPEILDFAEWNRDSDYWNGVKE
ncbi:MAG: hypothetical protein ACRCZK_04070 [Oscillospiraceae bacterium]